ncbi:MAG: hypothetical protein KKB29_03345, partial [Nanoarchaeota archaeon]|nr:hypothetical protein [Nanoarchaeota archaeon]
KSRAADSFQKPFNFSSQPHFFFHCNHLKDYNLPRVKKFSLGTFSTKPNFKIISKHKNIY